MLAASDDDRRAAATAQSSTATNGVVLEDPELGVMISSPSTTANALPDHVMRSRVICCCSLILLETRVRAGTVIMCINAGMGSVKSMMSGNCTDDQLN